jgi:hypothetical protein
VCGHRFEYLVLRTTPAAQCPACHGSKLEQLISLCAVSSEASREAHLSSAQKRAAAVRKDKQHEEHKAYHAHMDD